MFKNENLFSRKNFFKKSTILATGFLYALPNNINAQVFSNFLKRTIGQVTFIGKAIIVTETILGVLRAFDIDIAASVESFVDGFLDNSYNRFSHSNNGPNIERQISKKGESRCGYCQVGEFGYTTLRKKRNASVLWTPSINMWAGTGTQNIENNIELSNSRCGYPDRTATVKPPNSKNSFGGYTELEQIFEKGITRIIIDHSIPTDIESIYKKNLSEEHWIPS